MIELRSVSIAGTRAAGLTLALTWVLILAGCAAPPPAAHLDPAASAQAQAARRLSDAGLLAYLLSQGSPGPAPRWDLRDLTLTAFYFHPEVQLGRAQEALATERAALALLPGAPTLRPRLERHSDALVSDRHWSAGLTLEVPLTDGSRRQAQAAEATFLVAAQQARTGQVAWQLRSRLRARLCDLCEARELRSLVVQELAQEEHLQLLLEHRVAAGYASAPEAQAQARLAKQVAGALAGIDARTREDQAGLAAALGLPASALAAGEPACDGLDEAPAGQSPEFWRAQALRGRLDLRERLLEFAAADAAVRVEASRRLPTLSLEPGFLWDRGDRIWSLVGNLLLPPALTNAPAIREAVARREVQAKSFLGVQARVLGEWDGVRLRLAAAREARVRTAELGAGAQRALEALQRRFEAGDADRVELLRAALAGSAALRAQVEARGAARRALGALEDLLQEPLTGAPLSFPPLAPAMMPPPNQEAA